MGRLLPGEARAARLAGQAGVWAGQRGLVVRRRGELGGLTAAPLALLPTPFPRGEFERAVGLAGPLNRLVDAVSRDGAYLRRVLRGTVEHDEFTARLLGVYEAVRARKGEAMHARAVGVHRSDYMVDEPTGRLLQVELNTIASSFGALGTLVSDMHRQWAGRYPELGLDPAALPANGATGHIAAALACAHGAWGGEGALALVVVQPGELNEFDQQWIQETLWERHGIETARRTLAELDRELELAADGTLSLGGAPVAVVYFRAGYSPADYPTEAEWGARLTIEQSSAFKCPSIQYHLVGAKKVQQDLAQPGVLERFLDHDEAAALRTCFAGLWSLDDAEAPATRAALADAVANPGRYVLKPQREGGGNNLYKQEMAAKLRAGQGLGAYILMERINPPTHANYLVRDGELRRMDTLSEMGIYSTYVRDGDRVLLDGPAGHVLRTKDAASDEGGVAAGFAVIDSPDLY